MTLTWLIFIFSVCTFLTSQNWLNKSRLLSSLTKEIPSVCIDLSMKSWLLGPPGPMSGAAENMWQTICLQQGDQGGRAWVSAHHTARLCESACRQEMSSLHRLALQSPGEPSAILIIISQRNATQVKWRNCNLRKNAEKNTQTSASFLQENKVLLIDKALPKQRLKWTICRLTGRDLLICSSWWHSRIGEERRTVRQSVKVNKKSKRDQCNLDVIYF